ncbi:lipoprotein [Lentzea sp. NBRC 105346]|uniref:hypothetical protein n=1 Tax=Lentzea sp. NBRC 105346 TaxID=3032205 RepID=UPI0024A37D7C|nr:hypothetical protein [Lentzea sp. NBRC 105346]GLZ33715.1 lipoprotein [Lentzea sp. NBRC 105346]
MRRALAVLPALALVLSACGTSGNPVAQGPKPVAQQGKGANGLLTVIESDQVGWHVVNGNGMALYRFEGDSVKPPKSNCEGECAKKWPPVPAEGTPLTTGVDPLTLGVVTRADGTKQLTINGVPQYTFAGDAQPGDVKGQGSGGKWFATGPTGQKASLTAGMPGVPGNKGQQQQQPTSGTNPTSSQPAPPPGS